MNEKICSIDDLITVDLDGYIDAAECDPVNETFDLDGKAVS